MLIDAHVHLRDFKQKNKETIEHGFNIGIQCGIGAMFEMPNTNPPLTHRSDILRRIEMTNMIIKNNPLLFDFKHGLYIGLTNKREQIEEAISLHQELFPRVVGFKMYAGHSTGQMGIIEEKDRWNIYTILAKNSYTGVLAVHCEKEELIDNSLFNPNKPVTHSISRPAIAEINSIEEQIELALTANFRGVLHIAHISTPEGVDIIQRKKRELPFRLSCGITPHHLIFNTEYIESVDYGALLKVNPPIREKERQQKLMDYLLKGKIDWLESDHAPHTLEDKEKSYASGIPGIIAMRLFYEKLISMKIDRKLLKDLTVNSILDIFNLPWNISDEMPEVNFDEILEEYPSDPYRFCFQDILANKL